MTGEPFIMGRVPRASGKGGKDDGGRRRRRGFIEYEEVRPTRWGRTVGGRMGGRDAHPPEVLLEAHVKSCSMRDSVSMGR